jgi:hypothetical protein
MYFNEPPIIRDIMEDSLKAFKYLAKIHSRLAKIHSRKEKIKKIFDVNRKKVKS